ncbi:MAG: efflux RND transporter periplasmic adaptor subunit [Lachnospiraceae bacterium]|nr:efflux RND transporter periplasmic adaptor subunit [Lachnospiraceae bacterium]
MTDQEFEKELDTLLTEDASGKQKREKKKRAPWSRKKKIIIGVAALAVALVVVFRVIGGNKETVIPVVTAALEKGEVSEMLSISGPISGTDSAEVVSSLHAEILELLVKEGDRVSEGQVLARLDPTDVQKEVDIAQNEYDLAVANQEEAQRQAENGYGKAVQDRKAAELDYQRKSMLFEGGDVTQVELEAAKDALNDAKRQVSTYTLEKGKPVANRSYALQVKNAEYALEQKKKRLEETEVTSPITGTVVRVNSRVGRFADTVDDDKPLFAIDNLDKLEMKINVSEYSIGKVKVGQTAQIRADILGNETEQGVITSISPTGEEKGGGSTERVIPTTIQIQNTHTKLIAGISARAEIVLNEAKDAWVVPVSALLQKEDGTYLVTVQDHVVHMIAVESGVESDISVEVRGEGLTEGLLYVTAPDPTLEEGTKVADTPQ